MKIYIFVLYVAILLTFSACGNGGGSSSSSLTGFLRDSNVAGVDYYIDGVNRGVTGNDGSFEFEENKVVTFKIGSLIVGQINTSNIPTDNIVYPADIVGVDRTNTSDARLVKILRVLQSLDTDGNPSNGIFIDDNAKGFFGSDANILDANLSTLRTMVEAAGKTFISEKQARDHYKETLINNSYTPSPKPFVTIWETKPGQSTVTIYTNAAMDYNYTIAWGDGDANSSVTGDISHTYATDGNHSISISGVFPMFIPARGGFFIAADNYQINNISSWGDIEWKSFKESFQTCYNLESNATDTPDLSQVTDLSNMFTYSSKFNSDISNWDVSNVTNMSYMFSGAATFNKNISNWDVSNVTNMVAMFRNAKAFNQDIGNWDVSNVTNMQGMFRDAWVFDQDIGDWNVSQVTNMSELFYGGRAFNQDIGDWNVTNVTTMRYTFSEAYAFDQDLKKWNVSNVTDMLEMFRSSPFNQDISDWNVTNVTNMQAMFFQAASFTDQNLSTWDVSKVTYFNLFDLDSGGGNILPNFVKPAN